MTEFQKQVLATLEDMRDSINNLKKELNVIVEYIEESLTTKERRELSESIVKVKAGDTSDFVSWKKAKQELGV